MPPAPQLFVVMTRPVGTLPTVNRTFTVEGNISSMTPSGWTLIGKGVTVQFGPGGPLVNAAFTGATLNWQCTGTVNLSVPWGSMVQLTLHARGVFRVLPTQAITNLDISTTVMVRLFPAVAPTIALDLVPSPIVAAQVPVAFVFTGSTSSPQAAIQIVQYKVEGGQLANAVNASGNWSRFSVTLPLPPTTGGPDHVLTIRATDQFGTVGEITKAIAVQPDPPIVVPPGVDTTFTGAPTTSSITSWTRLEPQCTDADMNASSGARLFDPLWMLTRQWQMGEFQAEDAGSPIQARVRATTAMLCRRVSGELPTHVPASGPIPAQPYDPSRTPLEVLVERRPMRGTAIDDPRMLTFAIDAGLHFLHMLEAQPLSASYRSSFTAKLALQPLSPADSALMDDASVRYVQSMVGRAPDGRQLAALVKRTPAAQIVLDPVLNISPADRAEVQQTLGAWLEWYNAVYSEPAGAGDDGWSAPRLEYAVSVGTRFSAAVADEMTFSAAELDGSIDWSSFDVNPQAPLTTPADQGGVSIVEATIPAPVNFPGAPAPRFWEMEDARVAYGLIPVGPTDLAHLMLIEYASSYGNDWFIVPLTLPVGSTTRIDSLVVTDTFGVRSLIRPIGDPAIPAAHFSMWQPSLKRSTLSGLQSGPAIATNRFFLPPTLALTLDGGALEDVLFMRDEMANMAWAIERTVESPIERAAQRYEMADSVVIEPAVDPAVATVPRYLLSTQVPANWIPLLPVQVPNPQQPNAAGQVLTRLKRGAVLQLDGSRKVHRATADVLLSLGNALLYDEEVPREGARLTRLRRMARWIDGSTWVWTSFRNQVGRGEGSSQLKFDRVLEPPSGTD